MVDGSVDPLAAPAPSTSQDRLEAEAVLIKRPKPARRLGVRRAMVLGQVLPGVPVWQVGAETRHPGLSYIVFPGNVGGPEAVGNVVLALRSTTKG